MNVQYAPSWLLIALLAGGAILILGMIVAVVAVVGSKSKSGAGIAVALVALLLLGVPVLGLAAYFLMSVGQRTVIYSEERAFSPAVVAEPVEVRNVATPDIVQEAERVAEAAEAGGN